MAIYHLSVKIIKRGSGRSVVAAAAYRAAQSLAEEQTGMTHDYSRKRGVVESFVTTPFGKDNLEWAHDIERLANAMESHERRKDAQVAHQWRIALPAALTEEEREALTHEAAQKLSDASDRNAKILRAAITALQRLIQTIIAIVKDEVLPKGGYRNPNNAQSSLGNYSPTCKPVAVSRTA